MKFVPNQLSSRAPILMDEGRCQQLVYALDQTYSTTCSITERNDCYRFIEEFKRMSPVMTIPYALHFLKTRPNHADHLKHFALHIIQHVIDESCPTNIELSMQLRHECLDILCHAMGSSPDEREKMFIIEKMGHTLSKLAELLFPHHWPDFIPTMLQIWSQDRSTQSLVIARCLGNLAEEVGSSTRVLSSNLSTLRRKEIQTHFQTSAKEHELFPFLFQYIEQKYQSLQQQPSCPSSSSPLLIQSITFALTTLQQFLFWIPVHPFLIVSGKYNFIQMFMILGFTQSCPSLIRKAAMECLKSICSKTLPTTIDDHHEAVTVQADNDCVCVTKLVFQSFPNLSVEAVMQQDPEETLEYYADLNEILILWGNYQLEPMLSCVSSVGTKPEDQVILQLLQNYTRVLLLFFRFPSLILNEQLMNTWILLFKKKYRAKGGGTNNDVKILLQKQMISMEVEENFYQELLKKYMRLGKPSSAHDHHHSTPSIITCGGFSSEISSFEFNDDDDEFSTLHQCFRNLCHRLFSVFVSSQESTFISYFQQFIQSQLVLLTRTEEDAGSTAKMKICSMEGTTSLIDAVFKADDAASSSSCGYRHIEMWSSIICVLGVNWNVAPPQLPCQLIYRQLKLFSMLSKVFQHDQQHLAPVLEKCFQYLVFIQPGESTKGEGRVISTETLDIRRRAASSLVTICKAIPNLLVSYFKGLSERVILLFQQSLVLPKEKLLLYEMLTIVSNAMPSVEQRQEFLHQIVGDAMAFWTTDQSFIQIIASGQTLTQALIENAEQRQHVVELNRMNQCLDMFLGVMKHVKSLDVAAPFWIHIFPNLCRCIESLHELAQAQLYDVVYTHASQVRFVLAMTLNEAHSLLGIPATTGTLSSGQWMVTWQKLIRERSYHVFGLALSKFLSMTTCNVPPQFLDVNVIYRILFKHVDRMEHRHLKNVLSCICIPLIQEHAAHLHTSPSSEQPSRSILIRNFIDALISRVCAHGFQRLMVMWTCTNLADVHPEWQAVVPKDLIMIDHANNDDDDDDDDDAKNNKVEIQEDMIQDKIRIELTKTFLDLTDEVVSKACASAVHALSSSLISSVVVILIGNVCWQVSTSITLRSLNLLRVLFNHLHEDVRYHVLFGQDFFHVGIERCISVAMTMSEDRNSSRTTGSKKTKPVDSGAESIHWEMIDMIALVYCRLGLGIQRVEEWKVSSKKKEKFQVPTYPSSSYKVGPRQILVKKLPWVHSEQDLVVLDQALQACVNNKQQKIAMKEFLLQGIVPRHDVRRSSLSEQLLRHSQQQQKAASNSNALNNQPQEFGLESLFR